MLLAKGYEVHGVKRRSSSFNTGRIDHLYQDPHEPGTRFVLHYGDLTDATNLIRIVQETQPDEIYNLAAQSHVQVSFETPEYTANADALGTLRLLEAIRILGLEKKTRFYQASTSELYGKVQETPQSETTPFYPRCPYAAAKLYAYWITVNYREAYGMHASNGILFNHESPTARRDLRHPQDHPRRGGDPARSPGEAVSGQSRRQARLGPCARICAGHVADAAAGPSPTIMCWPPARRTRCAKFVERAFAEVGTQIEWRGKGVEEKGVDAQDRRGAGRDRSALFPAHRGRPAARRSDARRARLGWRHETSCRASSCGNGARPISSDAVGHERKTACDGMSYALAGKRVWVAGHRGMVGSAIVRRLAARTARS